MILQRMGMRLALMAGVITVAISATESLAQPAVYAETSTARLSTPPVQAGGVGWQKLFGIPIPKGSNLIYTDSCPDDAKVPVANSFSPNTAAKNGLQLIASFHPKANPQAWQWEIHWPAGAPGNSVIYFNIYCTTQ